MPSTGAGEGNANGLVFQADEKPPLLLTLALGAQLAILSLCATVFQPTIVHRAAGSTDEVLAWSVFVCLMVTAWITALQALPIGRFGGGTCSARAQWQPRSR